MKTATQYTIKLDLEEMTILRDLVRIGMKSKYYREYTTEEIDDYMCEDIRDRNVVAVMQFVNLNPVNQIEAMFDTKLFEGLVTVWEVAQGGLINPPIRCTLHSYLRHQPMTVTFQANYKEVFATETVEKIEQLVEDNYDLDDILEFIDANSEDDFISFYEEYVSAGENIGYDVVDAFVKYHGSMSYVEHVEDAYRGCYDDEETFAEEYYNEIYGDVPAFLVIDWEQTWKQSLTYDFDFVDGYVFSSNFWV